MKDFHNWIGCATLALVAGLSTGAAARAQTARALSSGLSTAAGSSTTSSLSTSSSMTTTTSSAGTTSGLYSGGMGMPMMALALPFMAGSGSNAASNLTGLPSVNTTPSNVFANPYAAPLLYGSMMPGLGTGLAAQGQTAASASSSSMSGTMGAMNMGAAQMGLLMLATQGSLGNRSAGDRRTARGQATTARQANGRVRTASPPGGLAARYFNRMSPRSPYPQTYYNRQNRYFP